MKIMFILPRQAVVNLEGFAELLVQEFRKCLSLLARPCIR